MAAYFVFAACAFFVIFMLIMIFRCRKKNHSGRQKSNPASLMIVVGSGGHTKEILLLMGQLGQHYNPRHYVIAASDSISLQKVHNSEKCNCLTSVKYFVHTIPRSREVKQSWVTTVFTTLYASVLCLPLVFRIRPEIILCNGPGTCIPVCIAGLLLKWFGLKDTKIVYVESVCRVESLSLSGKILYHFADSLLVQWPELAIKYPKCKYIGRVV